MINSLLGETVEVYLLDEEVSPRKFIVVIKDISNGLIEMIPFPMLQYNFYVMDIKIDQQESFILPISKIKLIKPVNSVNNQNY